jgi:hypothetical protein
MSYKTYLANFNGSMSFASAQAMGGVEGGSNQSFSQRHPDNAQSN